MLLQLIPLYFSCSLLCRWNWWSYKTERTWIAVRTGVQLVSRLGTWVFKGTGAWKQVSVESAAEIQVVTILSSWEKPEFTHSGASSFLSNDYLSATDGHPARPPHSPRSHHPLGSGVYRSHSPRTQWQSEKRNWILRQTGQGKLTNWLSYSQIINLFTLKVIFVNYKP